MIGSIARVISVALAVTLAPAIARSAETDVLAGPLHGEQRASPSGAAPECTTPCPPGAPLDSFGSLGLRFAETRVRFSDETATEAAVLFAISRHHNITLQQLMNRMRWFILAGGGSAGFEGGFGGELAFGWRAPFGEDHGAFARLGIRGHLIRNGEFHSSMLELPVGQAGYQLLRDRELLVELALSAAPMLVGRYNIDGASSRRLGGSFDWGGHLALRFFAVHFEAGYVRVVPDDDSRYDALDWWNAELCGEAWPIAACADVRFIRGDVAGANGGALTLARTAYLGFHFGVLTDSAQPERGASRARIRGE